MMPVRFLGLWVLWLLAMAWPVHAAETEGAPVLSHVAGFYDKPFFLRLSHPDPGVTIYYTLDGSDPHPAHVEGVTYRHKKTYSVVKDDAPGEFREARFQSHRYTDPLVVEDVSLRPDRYNHINTLISSETPAFVPQPGELSSESKRHNRWIDAVNRIIDWLNARLSHWGPSNAQPLSRLQRHEAPDSNRLLKAVVVKAAAFKGERQLGQTVSASYFIMKRETFGLPVVSLMVQEDRLFDHDEGMMVAGRDFEEFRQKRPDLRVVAGFVPANWKRKDVEVPMHFQYFSDRTDPARASVNQVVGMRIHGRITRAVANKSMRLYARKEYGASHMDHPFFGEASRYKRLILRNGGGDFKGSLFRDAVTQEASSGLAFETQAYQPAVVFLNGEYWGILNLREHLDRHHLERRFGVKEKQLDLIDLMEAREGSNKDWLALLDHVRRHGLREQRHFEHVAAQVDIDSYTDYFIANLYANNGDWPHNNQRFWRARPADGPASGPPELDGRWRWLMIDVDAGLRDPAVNQLRGLAVPSERHKHYAWASQLFVGLLDNSDYRQRFVLRYADLLNSHFETGRMKDIIVRKKDRIEPEIDRHILRWRTPETRQAWQDATENLLRFAEARPDIARSQLQDLFGLEDVYQLQVDVQDAPRDLQVRVNSLTLGTTAGTHSPSERPWTGLYFRGLPLQVAVEPAACFSHWEGQNSRDPHLTLRPNGRLHLKAVFRPACNT